MTRSRWIQRAIKRPGALKRWVRQNKRKIASATHMSPLKKDGDINIRALKKFTRTRAYQRLSPKTKHRIQLAITLNKLRKHK